MVVPFRRRSERPWQKRWIIFNGSELKYFKNKQDKDNLCLNTVELEKMIDVKRVQDVSSGGEGGEVEGWELEEMIYVKGVQDGGGVGREERWRVGSWRR